MQKIKQKGQIYLSGGGDENQSFSLDKFFFSTFPKNGRLLYIPIALRGHKLYSTVHLWMQNIIHLHERDDIKFEITDKLSNYQSKNLKTFNAVYIGGGNTWNLMQELKDSGFLNVLVKYFETGGQIYGGSAGAIIFGKRIDTQNDENGVGMEDVHGLNLLRGYSIACHFKESEGNQFKKWVSNNKSPLIGLPEETGLILKDNTLLCIGGKSCTIYPIDGTQKNINPGESFDL